MDMTQNTITSDNETKKTVQRPSDEIDSERLAEAGRAVADLAHLAKNIIQVLSGCAEIIDLALASNQHDRLRQAWNLYQPNFWRIKKLQLDLIKYTKAYPLNLQPCDIAVVIASAAKQLDPFFTKRRVSFSHTQSDAIPAVIADGEKLREAIINLLVAAVDNLQDEPGQVSIYTSLIENGDALCITVTDSGQRLTPDLCAALLTPHERCRNMLGTGLEIPLAVQTAKSHHGRLIVNSEQSRKFNSFELTLPLRPDIHIDKPTTD
jgi:signal transduction histidine kinase